MSYYDGFIENINRGRQGLNTGLPHGFERLTEYIPNIQQGTYYSVGGEAGSSKTSIVDNMFVLNPVDWYLDNIDNTDVKLEIDIWSFEISVGNKIAKFAARKIFTEFGILVDINLLLSKGKNRINDELYNYCISLKDHLDKLYDIINIIDVPMNPTGIRKHYNEYFDKHGRYEKVTEYRKKYIPNNPNLHKIAIFDHIALAKGETGYMDNKSKIDKISEDLVQQRNIHNLSSVVVNQFNRSLAIAERQMKTNNKASSAEILRPQQSDWKDSNNVAQDANIMIGIFSPNRYELPVFDDYNVARLGDRFRSINIVKNRDSNTDVSLGLAYLGEIGLFKELPKAEEMMIRDPVTKKDYYQTIEEYKKYSTEQIKKERTLFD